MLAVLVVGLGGARTGAEAATLEPMTLPGMCLSMSGEDGQAESRECDGGPTQDLIFPIGTGPIGHAGRCLAPRDGGLYPELFATDCNGSPGQTWSMAPGGEVRNAAGQCLAVLGLSSRSGERIYAGSCSTVSGPQRWRKQVSSPPYRNAVGGLETAGHSGECLAWIEAGSFIGLAACDDSASQRFSRRQDSFGHWRSKGGCLTGSGLGEVLTIGACGSGRAMMWLFRPDGRLVDGFGQCAEARDEHGRIVVRMTACGTAPQQAWSLRTSG
ncbi:ricin-type beta-trefoil lectin domain protein [Caulobacter henricii]|uniref:ricin-type beta-trefoil lectin domain protein n=1 Tax=Caulobacter henricii TaxID=69395 RepID=UPI001412A221|nr:ricin-type beta-trefoil lectin domain protein [Caulobacter henricii]